MSLAIRDRQHMDIELKERLGLGLSLFDVRECRPVRRPRGWRLAARTRGEAFRDAAPVGGPPIEVVLTARRARAEDNPFSVWRKNTVATLPVIRDRPKRAARDVVVPHLANIFRGGDRHVLAVERELWCAIRARRCQ